MNKLTFQQLVTALQDAGITRGDIVHVQSDILRIGPVGAPPTATDIFTLYVAAFQEVLGPEGTLTCCTAFEDYARYGTPFIREQSPSLTDALSEHIRTLPGAVRSIHPIVSVTGLGARAHEICGGNHYEGFGYDSPWGRLHRANALILSLGLGAMDGGTTFTHYPESLYSVPYKYTKLYSTPVYANGQTVDGLFTLNVRYLDFGIVNTPTRIKPHLLAKGYARLTRIGRCQTWSCRAADFFNETMHCLGTDRYFLLEQPPRFREGEIPWDGCTGAMQYMVDKQPGKVSDHD